jgi:ribosomal protein L37AE/L43A
MFRETRLMPREPTKAPDRCPQCGSPRVKTTSKPITASTYWRCEACGEIWNVGRRQPTYRYSH